MKTVFLRALDAADKSAVLRSLIREPEAARRLQRFEIDTATFRAIPRSPFAYWAPNGVLQLFTDLEPFEAERRAARHGAATLNNGRFLRLAWEVPPNGIGAKWRPYAKGGAYSPFYDDVHLLVRWSQDGAELKQYVSDVRESNGWGPHWTAVLNGYEYYLRPGLTWPSRTQSGFAPRVLPEGCIFDCKGNAAFFHGDSKDEILGFLAILLSEAFRALVGMQMSFGSYDVGVVQRTPVPQVTPQRFREIVTVTSRAFSLSRSLDSRVETSHVFRLPALLQVEGDTLSARADAWAEYLGAVKMALAAIQAEIDQRCFDLYGINEADRRTLAEAFRGGADGSAEPAEGGADPDLDGDDDGAVESSADRAGLAAELVSWAVGVAFGRFDVRLATGARALPAEPEPFDPLPVCSPAMLTGEDGLPVASASSGYPLTFPADGLLVDDPGHPRDFTGAVRAVFEAVFGARADALWQEAAALLEPKDHDLRAWLAAGFFEHHLKRHSKSRRKAPILWQLGVPSGRYSVWLYAHRLTRDSIFQLQNDVVAPKLTHEERQLTSLIQQAGGSPSAKERKAIVAQAAFVEALRALLDEVKRVAPLWNPTLDDGVVLTMAPLWRLVPQYKPWQRELKGKWDELCAGKYAWAHLAMHLWPERVVPKCATDRSLAIGHGLEEVFWVKGPDGKWQPRVTPVQPVQALVRERSSPAVKAALASLVDAPAAANGGRGRGRRAGRTATSGETG